MKIWTSNISKVVTKIAELLQTRSPVGATSPIKLNSTHIRSAIRFSQLVDTETGCVYGEQATLEKWRDACPHEHKSFNVNATCKCTCDCPASAPPITSRHMTSPDELACRNPSHTRGPCKRGCRPVGSGIREEEEFAEFIREGRMSHSLGVMSWRSEDDSYPPNNCSVVSIVLWMFGILQMEKDLLLWQRDSLLGF